MERMYNNAKSTRINYGDILLLTNWFFDSSATCFMTPYISYFIQGLLVKTDIFIAVVDGNLTTEKNRMSSSKNT